MEGVKGRKHRSLEERVALHSRTRELKSRGMKHKDIAAELGITPDEVTYWLRVDHPPHVERYLPDLTPRPELAYLVGAYLGDGRTAGLEDKKVRFNLADLEFANLLNDLVAKVLRTRPKAVKFIGGFHSVDYDSAALYDFLQQDHTEFESLMSLHPEMFLRGFYDAEGYVSPQLNHRIQRFEGVILGVVNTNTEYLSIVRSLLLSLGIRSIQKTTHKAGDPMIIRGRAFIRRHAVQHLVFTRRSHIEVFHEFVGFSVPQKKTKLDDLVMMRNQMSR